MRQSRDSGPLALARKGRAKPWVAACSALTLIVIICLSGAAGAAPGDVLWTDQWDLAGSDDRPFALGVSDNRVFVAGYGTNASGNFNWLVRAYDAGTGEVKWTDQWDLAGKDEYAYTLAVSGTRVFVAGTGRNASGNSDWLVRAYDAGTGEVKWTDQWDLAGKDDWANALGVSDNRVFVAGTGINASGNFDWLVRAYDAGTGEVLWSKQWDLAGGNDFAIRIAVSGNQVFVAGSGTNASGNFDWLVRAYDAGTGAVLWTDQWDLGGYGSANALAISANQVFVAGVGHNASGNFDWLVRAYDAGTGEVLWSKQWDLAGGYDFAWGIAVSCKQVLVAGEGTNASGNTDWLVRAYDAGTGEVKWTDQCNLAGKNDVARNLVLSGNQVLVAGTGTNASGNFDWLVRAYDAGTGVVLWTDQCNLAGRNGEAVALAVSGNQLFVAGWGINAPGNLDWLVRAYEVTPAKIIGINQVLTGKLSKKGVFSPTSTFKRGNKVAVWAHVQDKHTLQAFSNAAVNISITGPGFAGGFTGTTDSNGLAVVQWPTKNKTTKGTYTVTVTNVVPPDPAVHIWDGVQSSANFTLK